MFETRSPSRNQTLEQSDNEGTGTGLFCRSRRLDKRGRRVNADSVSSCAEHRIGPDNILSIPGEQKTGKHRGGCRERGIIHQAAAIEIAQMLKRCLLILSRRCLSRVSGVECPDRPPSDALDTRRRLCANAVSIYVARFSLDQLSYLGFAQRWLSPPPKCPPPNPPPCAKTGPL